MSAAIQYSIRRGKELLDLPPNITRAQALKELTNYRRINHCAAALHEEQKS